MHPFCPGSLLSDLLRPGPGHPLTHVGIPGEDLGGGPERERVHDGGLVLEEAEVVGLCPDAPAHLRELFQLRGEGLGHLLADRGVGTGEEELTVVADLVLPASPASSEEEAGVGTKGSGGRGGRGRGRGRGGGGGGTMATEGALLGRGGVHPAAVTDEGQQPCAGVAAGVLFCGRHRLDDLVHGRRHTRGGVWSTGTTWEIGVEFFCNKQIDKKN